MIFTIDILPKLCYDRAHMPKDLTAARSLTINALV